MRPSLRLCARRTQIPLPLIPLLILLLLIPLLLPRLSLRAAAPPRRGNAIFIHPDGASLAHWEAARALGPGPDGLLAWERLPESALYRGALSDRLAATSHGGATTHAFGVRVPGAESFGRVGARDEPPRALVAHSGFPGSILREAAAAGYPVGVVNDGDAAEPGTAAFFAEVDDRADGAEIVRQLLDGRPGVAGEPPLAVALGGGEALFLPAGTPRCGASITPDCAVHAVPLDGSGPLRADGRNLIREAVAAGWTVIRTRAEFDALTAQLAADPALAPRVLGLFAAGDTFNDAPEEALAAAGLVDGAGAFLLWGDRPGTPSAAPPSAAEMTALALTLLERRSAALGLPFLLVAEIESVDNFAGANNAVGTLHALAAADAVIATARAFQARVPRTLILTAADSNAGGMQLLSPPPTDDAGGPEPLDTNPTGQAEAALLLPLDGVAGRGTAPFVSAPDEAGRTFPFVVAWAGTADLAGGVVSRAQGMNAALLRTHFGGQLENRDVYRLLYLTLFGRLLPP